MCRSRPAAASTKQRYGSTQIRIRSVIRSGYGSDPGAWLADQIRPDPGRGFKTNGLGSHSTRNAVTLRTLLCPYLSVSLTSEFLASASASQNYSAASMSLIKTYRGCEDSSIFVSQSPACIHDIISEPLSRCPRNHITAEPWAARRHPKEQWQAGHLTAKWHLKEYRHRALRRAPSSSCSAPS